MRCSIQKQRTEAYQKCTVLGPMGLFQNFWKPEASAPAAVLTRRRAFARWKKGRKEVKMREPGRNDMFAVFVLLLYIDREKSGIARVRRGREAIRVRSNWQR